MSLSSRLPVKTKSSNQAGLFRLLEYANKGRSPGTMRQIRGKKTTGLRELNVHSFTTLACARLQQ